MITATQVNELRQRTKISIMLCKQALEATNGDQDKAVEWLRKNGNSISNGSDDTKSNLIDIESETSVINGISNVTYFSPDKKVTISVIDTSGDWHTLYSGINSYFKLRAHKE